MPKCSNYFDSELHCAHLWSYSEYKTFLCLLISHHLHWFNNDFQAGFPVTSPKRKVVTEKPANVLKTWQRKELIWLGKKKNGGLLNPEKNDLLCTTKHVHYATYEIIELYKCQVTRRYNVTCRNSKTLFTIHTENKSPFTDVATKMEIKEQEHSDPSILSYGAWWWAHSSNSHSFEFLTVLACDRWAECLQSCRTSSQRCEVLLLNNCILLQSLFEELVECFYWSIYWQSHCGPLSEGFLKLHEKLSREF